MEPRPSGRGQRWYRSVFACSPIKLFYYLPNESEPDVILKSLLSVHCQNDNEQIEAQCVNTAPPSALRRSIIDQRIRPISISSPNSSHS